MLREIIKGYWNVDPEDHRVAPYVSQALTSIARYERDGIPSHLKPSMQRALEFFEDAASYFNNKYAQFELANHYLAGDGVKGRVPHGLHWLANLTKRGHVGAQAFLATLHRDGRHVMRDGVMALAFITMAVENDKEKNRLIEDLHRNIFCDATAVTRRSARQRVFNWRKRYVEMQILPNGANELGPITPETQRTCANGDVVPRKMSNQPLRRQRQVEPTWKFGPTRSKTMKTRPNRNRSKLKSLNGFGSQEDLRPRQKKPRRDLNGFISRRER